MRSCYDVLITDAALNDESELMIYEPNVCAFTVSCDDTDEASGQKNGDLTGA